MNSGLMYVQAYCVVLDRTSTDLTLHIPLLTSRSPAYHLGHLNWVIGVVVATHTFQNAHLLILPFTAILHVLQKSNWM